ncbi:MAG: lipid-A-disaccharide synthase [Bacteroidota bacterium]
MRNIYIIAGEASGDLHGANLMKALKQRDETIQFRHWGGDQMAEIAGPPVKHISDLAFMGFIEVFMNLRTIFKNLKFCREDIEAFAPDALVLIDYPGFNLQIAKWAKQRGIPVIYYISPQVWAWKKRRVHTIKKVVDKMLVILPFEKDFYAEYGMDVEYVGHPLIDAVDAFQERVAQVDLIDKHQLDDRPVIALLPGSRKQEVQVKLPIMLKSLETFDDYQFVIAGAPSLSPDFYRSFLESYDHVRMIHNETYDLLAIAKGALVTSGTATLETALFSVPEVVCYKGSSISYQIAKRLVQVDYISLVNLILNREAVRELIQDECEPTQIKRELHAVLPGGERYHQLMRDYEDLIEKLGRGGASAKAAEAILKITSKG